ncbi:MAG: PAS domain S-box protein [bacterium]|nr:PAS domain S-box protein [bacterium]
MSTINEENLKIRESFRKESGLTNMMTFAFDGIIMLNSEDRISFWNKAAEEMFGYNENETAGREFTDFLPDEKERALFRESLLRSRKNNSEIKSGEKIELGIGRKDGESLSIDISFNSLNLNEQLYTVIIIHDISERMKIEKDLRYLNEHLLEQTTVIKEMGLQAEVAKGELMLLLDSINFQIWYLVDKKTFGAVNKAHAEFLGFEKRQLEYQKLSDILPSEKKEFWTEINNRAFSTGKQFYTEELIENSTGEKRIMSITMTPFFEDSGKIKHVICTGEDITEKKKMENTRIQKEKFKGVLELAGAACHELNQPLQVLSGHIKLILLKQSEENNLNEKLKIIDGQIERMTEITRRLQNLTSYETKDYLDSTIIDIYKASQQ